MTNPYNEISQRFPEIRDRIQGDAELPAMLMHHLAEWVKEMQEGQSMPELAGRIAAFTKWCEEQPGGKDASDDLFTILVVGFYEELFDCEATRQLLPKLIPLEDIVGNADYFKTWVGEENYKKALLQYGMAPRGK